MTDVPNHIRVELHDGLYRHRLLIVGTLVQQRTVRRRWLLLGEWVEIGRDVWHLTDAEQADLIAAIEAGEPAGLPALARAT